MHVEDLVKEALTHGLHSVVDQLAAVVSRVAVISEAGVCGILENIDGSELAELQERRFKVFVAGSDPLVLFEASLLQDLEQRVRLVDRLSSAVHD